ncbi:hypothetical protein BFJ63_vAg12946 [Fusarium oxysporum f. sp. narcissi]|uniref:25-hydroxycholesterol 7-alpha-hydroxylase n=2 Tax=Fusarium oxysporum TaxID=5507 RepID=A0A420QZF8_FUSOX|nr:hypothetical protein BFJ71_g15061 [Fusarium oxysporum]RKL10182.1 hypothetical protein BFJ68_g8798 [Fusarium oxysporum]RYC84178.1 hypothetical protein BFJ63_vAg12946 [Fusarium oxysporum f. sp. narcissi]
MNATETAAANPGSATEATTYFKVLSLVVLPFIVTYVFTSFGNKGYQHGQSAREPPRVPYWIPYVGNTIGFAFDTERFLSSILSKFGKVPLRIFVGAEPMYFIPHGQPIIELFKASRHLTTKSLGVMTVRDAFGLPECDMPIYVDEDSEFGHVDPLKRFDFVQHRDLHALLTGGPLNSMTAKFVEVYSDIIEKDTRLNEDDWTEVDDLYEWLKNNLLRAAITALCGDKFLEISPNFLEDFWLFDYHLPSLFKRMPRWLVPKSYAARDKCVESMLRYHEYGNQLFDFTDEDGVVKKDWTSEFGTRLMSARQKMFQSVGMTPRGGAALDLGLMWAVNANAIPAGMWILLDILLDKDLKDRVMAEMQPSFIDKSLSFEIDKLCSGPLINSIYLETLRLRVASPVGRTSIISNLKFGKWQLKKGVGMLSSSWVGGHDPDFWNTGHVQPGGVEEHPVESFWAERFLVYENDPASGPVRPTTSAEKPAKRTSEDDRKARSTIDGTQGYWYPYGGGTKMCPGRFFAKQELIAAVAVALRAFDIELVDPEAASKVRPNMDYFPFGTIPPKGKVAARIRRRKL